MQQNHSPETLARSYDAAVELSHALDADPEGAKSEGRVRYLLHSIAFLVFGDDPDDRMEILLGQALNVICRRGREDFAANEAGQAFADFTNVDDQVASDLALGAWIASYTDKRLAFLKEAIENSTADYPFSVLAHQAVRLEREAIWKQLYEHLAHFAKRQLFLERQVIEETDHGFNIMLSKDELDGHDWLSLKDNKVSLIFTDDGYRVLWTYVDGSKRDILRNDTSLKSLAKNDPVFVAKMAITDDIEDWAESTGVNVDTPVASIS